MVLEELLGDSGRGGGCPLCTLSRGVGGCCGAHLRGPCAHDLVVCGLQEGTSGKTPLHLAVECHNRRAVQFLLRNGAYVDAQMYNGCTPLHLAVGRKDAAIAAILSHSGADTLLRNMENETAQDLADGNDDVSLRGGRPVSLQVCRGGQESDDLRGHLLGGVSSCAPPPM